MIDKSPVAISMICWAGNDTWGNKPLQFLIPVSVVKDLYQLPDDLPILIDDGACDHLLDTHILSVLLKGVSGDTLNIVEVQGKLVFFIPWMEILTLILGQVGVKFPVQGGVHRSPVPIEIIIENFCD